MKTTFDRVGIGRAVARNRAGFKSLLPFGTPMSKTNNKTATIPYTGPCLYSATRYWLKAQGS